MVERERRRRAAVLGVPALIVAALALAALWRVGGVPHEREPGAAGTIGLNPDRKALLERVQVRQLTSERSFWVGSPDDDPVFVVADRPLQVEPGSAVTIEGRVEAAPDLDAARRAWGVDESTARKVRERGVYVRASRITPER